MPVFQLTDQLVFPPPHLSNPDGILAIGGDLSTERLVLAYRMGIFPWYSLDEPILWWSPDPRFILFPERLKISKSMKQVLRKGIFEISVDKNFREVIEACSKIPRKGQYGTWITRDMINAYIALHREGFAHSVEVWQEGALVGGLYGVSLGSCFFGESMFAKVSNASKAGFITFVQALQNLGFSLIDCQVYTEHLASLGAEEINREDFLELLEEGMQADTLLGSWTERLRV